jgi:hypothetical protein
MPNILIYVSPETYSTVAAILPELGKDLRETTARVLEDIVPEQVAVMVFQFLADDNATSMQIFCVANTTAARELKLQKWAKELAVMWQKIARKYHIDWGDNVDVWPVLVNGFWMKADRLSVHNHSMKDLADSSY